MVSIFMTEFILKDYELEFIQKLQNFKLKDMSMKSYIEEFCQIQIKSRHFESSKEKVSRYVNGLKFNV